MTKNDSKKEKKRKAEIGPHHAFKKGETKPKFISLQDLWERLTDPAKFRPCILSFSGGKIAIIEK
jgi:hypothetical protein